MAEEKKGKDIVSYVLGIVSIVLAFFQPFAGLILGIIGVFQSKQEKSELSRKGKKYSIIGIVLSIIMVIISIAITIYFAKNQGSFGLAP